MSGVGPGSSAGGMKFWGGQARPTADGTRVIRNRNSSACAADASVVSRHRRFGDMNRTTRHGPKIIVSLGYRMYPFVHEWLGGPCDPFNKMVDTIDSRRSPGTQTCAGPCDLPRNAEHDRKAKVVRKEALVEKAHKVT